MVMVVSESRDAMTSEIEAMQRNSHAIVESIDYHRSVLVACDSMLEQLNPQIAKEMRCL